MSAAAAELNQRLTIAGTHFRQYSHSVGSGIGHGSAFVGRNTAHAARLTGRGIGSGVMLGGRMLGSAVAFTFSTPGRVLGYIGNTMPVSAVIKPAGNTAAASIPTIGGNTLAKADSIEPAASTLPAKSVPQPVVDDSPEWPIHGEITTYFGVVHWPYQPTHTGIDISDGKASGSTPVKPYKPGTVIEVISSNSGLGNHVTVDHGGGITSVYGHLYSTSVTVGQVVDKTTTLGLEGSTGASTGTHVHFEIRVGGQPVNPMLYVSGMP